MKKIIICLLLSTFGYFQLAGQEIKPQEDKYPYKLPIWGDKAYERGYKLQLPFGIGVNYVYNEMYLDISEFGMSINGVDMSPWLNKETLGFQQTVATSNGINFRLDGWILPFLNVYGLFSQVSGSTSVKLAPNLGGIQFPEFGSDVDFDASAYGLGATLVYGYKNYFISWDINHSWTETELLTKQVGVLTSSARLGRAFNMKKDRRLAFYVGMMYRNFTKAEGNSGSIKFNEALPGIDEAYTNWYDGLTPLQQRTLDKVYDSMEKAVYDKTGQEISLGNGEILTGDVGYFIKKDLVQTMSIQFGGQFEFNKHWALRGEFGIADELKFILFGMNYRFGF
ncbi:hypothetical protein K5X82_17500 [Halosquirtibacter xylanolyticus]|uniref:hypothetical protein n=1 Tax=Halosquirtibacter xylanolyticus TaxID=3374599 RepID=UPI003748E9F7|nr:hypothetical protein K5X82_17500 [Prolixibacteraceae bacterium]